MMPTEAFWNFVTFRPGLAAAAVEWRECLGEATWNAMRPTMFTADGVARNVRLGDRTFNVSPLKSGAYALVCDVTCSSQDRRLDRADVQIYRLNATQWCKAIASCLGIRQGPHGSRLASTVCDLGTLSIAAGVSLPVYLYLPPTADALSCEVRRLLLQSEAGFMLLTPTEMSLGASLCVEVQNARAMLVSLSEIIDVDSDGVLAAKTRWRECTDSYRRTFMADSLVEAPPAYAFLKQSMWLIRFAGKETALEDTLKGPIFIRYLLQRPGEEIHVARMLADIVGDERVARASSGGDLIDKQTLDESRRKYVELQAELAEAEENKDLGQIAKAKSEIAQLASYFSECVGLGNKSRKTNDDVSKIRKRITRVIEIAYRKIDKSDQQLAAHLRNSIKFGAFMKYDPEVRLEWNFE